jgi:hypothetical protein
VKIRSLALTALISILSVSVVQAQRPIGASALTLRGSGASVTLLPPSSGSGNFTFEIPAAPSNSTFILSNSTTGQSIAGGLTIGGHLNLASGAPFQINGATGGTGTFLGIDGAGSLAYLSIPQLPSGAADQTLRYDASTGWTASSVLANDETTVNVKGALHVRNPTNNAPTFRSFTNGNAAIGTANALNYGGYNAVGLLTNKRGLTIASATSYTANAPAVLELIGSATNVGDEIGMIEFINEASNGSTYNVARVTAVRENTNPTFTGLAFYTRNLANEEKMRITTNGNVGIGCATPNYKLHVVGDIAAEGTLRATSAVVSTTITACSDVRYKKDIKPLESTLNSLQQIEPVRYKFRVDEFPERDFSADGQIGFIAQEVEKQFPEVVVTDENGYKSIDYTRFAPILLRAVKEQQLLIESQQAQIEEIKGLVRGSLSSN